VELEKRGVPTVTFVTTAFAEMARAEIRSNDIPEMFEGAIAVMPHPLAPLSPEEIDARARELLPVVERILNIDGGHG
jgi:hypothetical protein